MRTTSVALCAALALIPIPALAADLGPDVQTASQAPLAVAPESARQFYVRGDVGIAQYGFSGLSQDDLSQNGGSFISQSIGDSATIGVGLGWRLSQHLRVDLTAEYLSTASISGLGYVNAELVNPDGQLKATTQYQGNYSAAVGLLNAYWDIGDWRGITPYLGAGIGLARNQLTGVTEQSTSTFTDAGTGADTVTASAGVTDNTGHYALAWALMAGTSYDLSPNAKLDLGYRYLHLGSGATGRTGPIDCVCGLIGQPLSLRDIDAQEVRLGLRWELGNPAPINSAPLK